MRSTIAKLSSALLLGVVGFGLIYFRHMTFYSYDVHRTTEVEYSGDHATLFVLTGLCCTALAVAFVRGAYRSYLRR
jgi:hypothetical protein